MWWPARKPLSGDPLAPQSDLPYDVLGLGLQEFSPLSSGKGQVIPEKESPAGSWPGAGEEGPGGRTQGIQFQGQPCCLRPPGLSTTGIPAASCLSPAPGTDFPQPQPAGAPWAIHFLPRSRRSPSGGGPAPHQQGQKRQEGHRRPPCSLTDPELTRTDSRSLRA